MFQMLNKSLDSELVCWLFCNVTALGSGLTLVNLPFTNPVMVHPSLVEGHSIFISKHHFSPRNVITRRNVFENSKSICFLIMRARQSSFIFQHDQSASHSRLNVLVLCWPTIKSLTYLRPTCKSWSIWLFTKQLPFPFLTSKMFRVRRSCIGGTIRMASSPAINLHPELVSTQNSVSRCWDLPVKVNILITSILVFSFLLFALPLKIVH